ncbi:MAG: lipocalin family protein [Steroidobacteraceae bacterium]|jgi:apolipoprotein D and lipocalin family protein
MRGAHAGRRGVWILGLAALGALGAGCVSTAVPTVPVAKDVDLPRFMGDWYVIASIPSYPERQAYEAVESYELRPDGRIQTTFRYRKGSFEAPLQTMRPVGTVVPDTGNAVWGMQFIWPIKAEYVISYLDADYSETLIARSKRDYAWIMARTPEISAAAYAADVERLKAMGYDVSKLRKVPQRVR